MRLFALMISLLVLPANAFAQEELRSIDAEFLRVRVERAIRHRAPWPADALEIAGWRLPAEFSVPAGHLRLRVHFAEREDFIGRLNASVEFLDGEREDARSIRRTVGAELIVRRPVVVAATKLRRGAPLDSEALRTETRDLRGLPPGFISDPATVLGQTLARSLPEGMPLLRVHLHSEPVVKRGEIVRIEAAGGGLDISIEARALEKGAVGQRIRFENPGTRRRFVAEITEPGRARLAPPGQGRPGVGAR